MSNERNIKRGGLSGKMGGYQPVPPESVWEGVASGLRGKRFNRKLFIFLGAAAGLALAISVGITFFIDPAQTGIAKQDEGISEKPSTTITEKSSDLADSGQKPGRPGTGDRLEQKVVTAMQEVIEEQEAVEDNLAKDLKPGQNEMDEGVTDTAATGENIERFAIASDEGRPDQQQQQIEHVKRQDNTGTGTGQVRQTDVDTAHQVVNEDSLLRLLQDDVPDIIADQKKSPGKWQLGATLSPLISYRDASSTVAAQNVAVNNSESARLTYAGGLQLSYLPTEKLAIQTGIYYNKMGVNIGDYSSFKSGWFESATDMVYTPTRTESVVSISNSIGTVVSSDNDLYVNNYAGRGTVADYHTLTPEEMSIANASVAGFSQTLEYLEIPFNVRYTVFDRNFGIHLLGGISANLLVNNSISAIAGDEAVTIGEVQDIRTFNYSGNAGLGMVYDLFKHFSLSIEPRFRYYLNSVNTEQLPVTRPYTFGLYTGINYKF